MSFINLIVLRCADIERTRAFYECLGLEFERQRHGDGPEHLTEADHWYIFLELYPASAKNPPDKIGIGFGVGSLENTAASLKAKGFQPDDIKQQEWGRTFVVRDPEGRRVEVRHQPSEADPDFEEELKRRIDDLDSGKTEGIPAEQVFKELEERIKNRPPRVGPDEWAS